MFYESVRVFASTSWEFADHSMTCTASSKTFNLEGLQTSNIFIPNEKKHKLFYEAVPDQGLNYKERERINHKVK